METCSSDSRKIQKMGLASAGLATGSLAAETVTNMRTSTFIYLSFETSMVIVWSGSRFGKVPKLGLKVCVQTMLCQMIT